MSSEQKSLIIALLLIAIGVGWLLTTLELLPGVDWVWSLGLAIVGVLAFLIAGLNKISVVVGPFLLVASALSVARQVDRISIDTEIPILVITAGILLLIARSKSVSVPKWVQDENCKDK